LKYYFLIDALQNGSADTSNFDEEFTKEQPTLTPVHGQLSSRDQAEFNGFSWVSRISDLLAKTAVNDLRCRWLTGQTSERVPNVVFPSFYPCVLFVSTETRT
jgi:hypothetical protein